MNGFEDKEPTLVYKLGKITYLPHYFEPNKYVSPGYNPRFYSITFSAEQLRTMGASPMTMKLWARPWKG
jgi:hypothetical protein